MRGARAEVECVGEVGTLARADVRGRRADVNLPLAKRSTKFLSPLHTF
jgi:hypothetical protein